MKKPDLKLFYLFNYKRLLITLVIYKERELKLALRKNCVPVCISHYFFTKIYTAQQGFMRYLPVKKAQKYSYGNIVYLQLLILLSLLYKLLYSVI